MANLDTRSKRASSICILLPFMLTPVSPGTVLNLGDKRHIAWVYSGILVGYTTGCIKSSETLRYVAMASDAVKYGIANSEIRKYSAETSDANTYDIASSETLKYAIVASDEVICQ